MISARIMPMKNAAARSAISGPQRALLHAALHLAVDALVDRLHRVGLLRPRLRIGLLVAAELALQREVHELPVLLAVAEEGADDAAQPLAQRLARALLDRASMRSISSARCAASSPPSSASRSSKWL